MSLFYQGVFVEYVSIKIVYFQLKYYGHKDSS